VIKVKPPKNSPIPPTKTAHKNAHSLQPLLVVTRCRTSHSCPHAGHLNLLTSSSPSVRGGGMRFPLSLLQLGHIGFPALIGGALKVSPMRESVGEGSLHALRCPVHDRQASKPAKNAPQAVGFSGRLYARLKPRTTARGQRDAIAGQGKPEAGRSGNEMLFSEKARAFHPFSTCLHKTQIFCFRCHQWQAEGSVSDTTPFHHRRGFRPAVHVWAKGSRAEVKRWESLRDRLDHLDSG
jgi:hypothetical protein